MKFTVFYIVLVCGATAFVGSVFAKDLPQVKMGASEGVDAHQKISKKDGLVKVGVVVTEGDHPAAVEDEGSSVRSLSEGNRPADNVFWAHDFLKKSLGNKNEVLLFSEDQGGKQKVTLEEAVVLALENDNEIKAALEESQSAHWDKVGAYGQFLPSMTLDLSVGHERSRPAAYNDTNGDRMADDLHLRKDRSLMVRQPIFDLLIVSDIISSSKKEEISKLGLMQTRDTIAGQTIQAYLKLLQSKIFLQLADDYLDHLAELHSIMEDRVAAGGAVNADLDRILSRAGAAESAQVEAEAEYDVAVSEFLRLTGVLPESLVLPKVLVPNVPKNFDIAVDQASQNNPNYLSSLKKIDLAKSDRNKAASAVIPKLYAQLSRDYVFNPGGAANGNPVDGVYPNQRTDKAMLVAQWSIYGGAAFTGAMSGDAKSKAMYFSSNDIREKMTQSLKINYTAVSSAEKRVGVLKESVEANERMVNGFKEQFKAGTRSLFELLDAYEQSYNSSLNLTRAIFANSQAAYQILQQTGEIVHAVAESEGAE